MEFSDGQLIEEATAGSAVAFEQLMARYEKLVFKVAFGVTGERENALDILQNVFLKVHRKLSGFRTDGDFRNWIARIAMNESINWRRSQRRHQADQYFEDAQVFAQPEQELLIKDREAWEMVKRSMDALKPKYRTAIALRYFEGMSVRDVARTMGCREGTVKSILFRSLQQMRAIVGMSTEVAS